MEHILKDLCVDVERGKVFWVTPSKYHNNLIGKEAGSSRPTGSGKEYWVIQYLGKKILRGHLVFFAQNGHWPVPCLDHINGNSRDDRASNIRQATIQQNAMNHKSRKCKSGLPMGVRLVPSSGRYGARISLNRQQYSLGTFDTPEEAAKVYQKKRKELFGEFA